MVEYLVRVNKQNKIIGTCARPICHAKKMRHRGVHIIVFDSRGNVLVTKRSSTKDVFPGLYEASLSGHVQWKENPANSAVRELKEELGIKRKRLRFIGTFAITTPKECEIIALYSVQYVQNKLRFNKKEVAGGLFVPITEFVHALRSHRNKFTPGTIAAWNIWKKK